MTNSPVAPRRTETRPSAFRVSRAPSCGCCSAGASHLRQQRRPSPFQRPQHWQRPIVRQSKTCRSTIVLSGVLLLLVTAPASIFVSTSSPGGLAVFAAAMSLHQSPGPKTSSGALPREATGLAAHSSAASSSGDVYSSSEGDKLLGSRPITPAQSDAGVNAVALGEHESQSGPMASPSSVAAPFLPFSRYKLPPLLDGGIRGRTSTTTTRPAGSLVGGASSSRAGRSGSSFFALNAFSCASPNCRDPNCRAVDDNKNGEGVGGTGYDEEVPDLLVCSFIQPSTPSSHLSESPGVYGGANSPASSDEVSSGSRSSPPSTDGRTPPPGLKTHSFVMRRHTTSALTRRRRARPEEAAGLVRMSPDDPAFVLYQRQRPTSRITAPTVTDSASKKTERLLQVSNVASMLCVVDCTVLPLATIGLSVASSLTAGAASAAASSTTTAIAASTVANQSPIAAWIGDVLPLLHEWGHLAALYFVVPIGVLASTVNYSVHRSKRIAAVSLVGLILVVLANAGCGHGFVHALEAVLPHAWGHAIHRALHAVHHHAVLHRVVNLLGCAFLLLGNHLSRQHSPTCANANCQC